MSDAGRTPPALAGAIWIAALLHAAPEFPGRNLALQNVRRFALGYDRQVSGYFGPGLRVEGNPAVDSNSLEPLLLRFTEPELGPILRAALCPGQTFVDVGANVGTYSLMAASLVGPTGRVMAFEPVPETRARLECNVALNHVPRLEIIPKALGSAPGTTVLHVAAGASGLSSRYTQTDGSRVEVETTTLDRELAGAMAPTLIKIDVEGMELEVMRGARELLRGDSPPLIVFEAHPDHMRAAATDYTAIRTFLADNGGYQIYALGRRGLRNEPPEARAPSTADVLAARPDSEAHTHAIAVLRGVHFRGQEPAAYTKLLARLRERLG